MLSSALVVLVVWTLASVITALGFGAAVRDTPPPDLPGRDPGRRRWAPYRASVRQVRVWN